MEPVQRVPSACSESATATQNIKEAARGYAATPPTAFAGVMTPASSMGTVVQMPAKPAGFAQRARRIARVKNAGMMGAAVPVGLVLSGRVAREGNVRVHWAPHAKEIVARVAKTEPAGAMLNARSTGTVAQTPAVSAACVLEMNVSQIAQGKRAEIMDVVSPVGFARAPNFARGVHVSQKGIVSPIAVRKNAGITDVGARVEHAPKEKSATRNPPFGHVPRWEKAEAVKGVTAFRTAAIKTAAATVVGGLAEVVCLLQSALRRVCVNSLKTPLETRQQLNPPTSKKSSPRPVEMVRQNR